MSIDPRNAAASSAESLTYIPEGRTAESWASMCRISDVLERAVGKIPPSPPRCIQDLRDGKCYVYFIGGEGTPIKIGLSYTPYERLAALQTGHWVKLEILAKVEGGFPEERAYHDTFAASRLVGEWFERTPELLAEIERLAA